MKNFEKRMLVEYLDKVAREIDFDSVEIEDLILGIVSTLKIKKINLNEMKDMLGNTSNDYDEFRRELRKEITKLKKNSKHKISSFEEKLIIIKKLYTLEEEDYSVLIFYILKELSKTICLLSKSLRVNFSRIYFNRCYGHRMRDWECNLQNYGILLYECGKYYLNKNILDIFTSSNYNSENKIIIKLLGKEIKSKLKAENFTHLSQELNKSIKLLESATKSKQKGVNILLYGDVGCGKTEFAKLIANNAKITMHEVITETKDFCEAKRKDRLTSLRSLQKILSHTTNSCILFDEAQDVMNTGFSIFGDASKSFLNKTLEESPVPIIWTTNDIYEVDPAFLRRMTYAIEFEKPNDKIRLNIWKQILKENKFKISNEKLIKLSQDYEIAPALIENAIKSTKIINGTEDDFEDFIKNVEKVVSKKKRVKKENLQNLDDYDINCVNTDIDILDLTEKIKESGNLNFSLCLYGEPGTGKSQYARYLANYLGIDVVFKRASDIKSKWVGETERNIASAFEEARDKKAMLIFDEADSFLQNRNNARASWEVSQVNEMLTWMESHPYPFICTTNLMDSLDEASLRRFTFKIRFDFLNKEQANLMMENFFDIETDFDLQGLTPGDFATVKKKVDFLKINSEKEIIKMLQDEVKVKKSDALKKVVGFNN